METAPTELIPITISYHKLGTKPPVFVGGTFSDPPWILNEMAFHTDDSGEYVFTHNIAIAQSSTIQYKYRLGIGDWWALDEDAPRVTDGVGNLNNVLVASEWRPREPIHKLQQHSTNESIDAMYATKVTDAGEHVGVQVDAGLSAHNIPDVAGGNEDVVYIDPLLICESAAPVERRAPQAGIRVKCHGDHCGLQCNGPYSLSVKSDSSDTSMPEAEAPAANRPSSHTAGAGRQVKAFRSREMTTTKGLQGISIYTDSAWTADRNRCIETPAPNRPKSETKLQITQWVDIPLHSQATHERTQGQTHPPDHVTREDRVLTGASGDFIPTSPQMQQLVHMEWQHCSNCTVQSHQRPRIEYGLNAGGGTHSHSHTRTISSAERGDMAVIPCQSGHTNWLRTFFRAVFVDWISGLLCSKIFRSHKT